MLRRRDPRRRFRTIVRRSAPDLTPRRVDRPHAPPVITASGILTKVRADVHHQCPGGDVADCRCVLGLWPNGSACLRSGHAERRRNRRLRRACRVSRGLRLVELTASGSPALFIGIVAVGVLLATLQTQLHNRTTDCGQRSLPGPGEGDGGKVPAATDSGDHPSPNPPPSRGGGEYFVLAQYDGARPCSSYHCSSSTSPS